MRKIRVLITDDSVVIRRLLTDILAKDPEIEVVGTASNGRIALAKMRQLNPDLVIMDIEMPELDGLETLPLLRKDYPKLPVIMFSTLTDRGATATFDALARGATDYVAKPANIGSVAEAIRSVTVQLIPKIKALCPFSQPASIGSLSARSAVRSTLPRLVSQVSRRCDLVIIGASTGWPQALTAVLRKLPAAFAVPVIIVQHMPPVFTRHLARRLDQECHLHVREASSGDEFLPGEALIAPGDFHLELQRQGTSIVTVLNQNPPENSCRPAIDVAFRSAANVCGPGCLAVVLTGMGQDGRRGAESIVQGKGTVLVQDEETSVVWGMPRAVAEAGLASRVLPLQSISSELISRVADFRQTTLTPERIV